MDRLRQTVTPWLASRHHLELIHFPPSPKKFLHLFLGCLKSSRSRFKSFYFFRKKLRSFEGFDQMSAFWSMFWFKPFRNFLRKIAIFRNFDHWSEILSMSAGRPLSQGVCPPPSIAPCLPRMAPCLPRISPSLPRITLCLPRVGCFLHNQDCSLPT